MGGQRGLKGDQSGEISDKKRSRKRQLHKEIGLSNESGKVGNLQSLALEIGVFSY